MKLLASLLLLVSLSTAAAPLTTPDTSVWEFESIEGLWPAARVHQGNSTAGIIVGSIDTEVDVPWWAYYTESTPDEFMVVGIAVDGKVIALCDDVVTFCSYIADTTGGGGGSFISLTDEQVNQIKNGTRLDFIVEMNDEVINIVRGLVGAEDAISVLLAVTAPVEPYAFPLDDTWTLYETIDPKLGKIVMIHAMLPVGEVSLSYSHTAFVGQFIDLAGYSGAEMFFLPAGNTIAGLASVHWSGIGNGNTIPVDSVESTCDQTQEVNCFLRDGISIVLTEKDLLFFQAGRELVVLWVDPLGNRFKSTISLGSEANTFNTRVRELKGTSNKTT